MTVRVITGDCREVLRTLPDESVHCVVTSPPYWGLRDYGVENGIGLEATLAEHIENLVGVFREVRRVLRSDGTLWLNYGDAYASTSKGSGGDGTTSTLGPKSGGNGISEAGIKRSVDRQAMSVRRFDIAGAGLKVKDLMGLPWRLAFALQADGWWLRQDIIWSKPNPMPESVTDRCTKAHEYLFLMAKAERYYFDADAIRTPFSEETKALSIDTMDYKRRDKYRAKVPGGWDRGEGAHGTIHRDGRGKPDYQDIEAKGANKRSVWTVATEGYAEAHFATFPPALIEPCIKAGCPMGGTVLDPFGGAGTTGLVADRLGCDAILIELNPAYADMARRRVTGDAPLFAKVAAE